MPLQRGRRWKRGGVRGHAWCGNADGVRNAVFVRFVYPLWRTRQGAPCRPCRAACAFARAALPSGRGDAAERLLSCLDDAAQDQEAFAAFYRELRQDYALSVLWLRQAGCRSHESVYRTDDGTLFGPTTLEVRAAYAAFGYALESSASERMTISA
ncbi:MAG: molecular chaperone TorD family protein [Eggerthellaceae bacterium]